MEASELLSRLADFITAWPSYANQRGISSAMYDGDHKSGELVLVTEKDGHQEWLISSSKVCCSPDEEENRQEEVEKVTSISQAAEIKRLVETDSRLEEGCLDDVVHDLASNMASGINNEGIEGQAEYIARELQGVALDTVRHYLNLKLYGDDVEE